MQSGHQSNDQLVCVSENEINFAVAAGKDTEGTNGESLSDDFSNSNIQYNLDIKNYIDNVSEQYKVFLNSAFDHS